jgi:crotonobetainyl-CoA:carnitine CoA-transferase CaiB-like acyl-CoA transferase
MSTIPTRIDRDLFDEAKRVGQTMNRSATQQVDHWARLGKVVEQNATGREVQGFLAGTLSYDDVSTAARPALRERLQAELAQRLQSLNLAEEFERRGVAYSDLDSNGNVVEHPGR